MACGREPLELASSGFADRSRRTGVRAAQVAWATHPWMLKAPPQRLPRRSRAVLPLLQRMIGAPHCSNGPPAICSHAPRTQIRNVKEQASASSLACTECLLHGILPQECLNPPVALHWRCLYPHTVPPVLPSDARHHEGILAMLLTICDGLRAPGSCGVLRGKARGGVHAMQGAWPGARSPCC